MDEMYDIILNEGYGMKLKSAARTRTCLVCTTDKGIFDLKKNIYDENINKAIAILRKSRYFLYYPISFAVRRKFS